MVTKPELVSDKTERWGHIHSVAHLTNVKDGNGKFNMTKMTGAFEHIFSAGTASNGTVNGTELWVVEALFTGPVPLFVHGLGVLNVTNTHIFYLLGRKETKLNLLNRLQRSAGIRERVDVHDGR